MNKFYPIVFIFLLLALPMKESMSAPAIQSLPAVESYEQLLSAIRQTKAQSRERVEALVEQEKVREAWEIGKLIDAHVLQHKPRASYDKQVVVRLAKDLNSSPTEVWYMLRFAREYPILRPAEELSWSHYQALLALHDPKEREEVAKQAAEEHWVRERVREEVRKRHASRKQGADKEQADKEIAEEVLTATPGKPRTYRVVKAYYGKNPDQLVLDLGFSNYHRPPGEFLFKEGDIVNIVTSDRTQGASENLVTASDVSSEELFAYSATVIHVIDGDTFTAAVDLGFGFTTVQTLRLRALDAPEVESTSGREAKEFLEKKLPKNGPVLIKTVGSDKYDRYLADVFVDGEYINQKLVEQGFAVPVSE